MLKEADDHHILSLNNYFSKTRDLRDDGRSELRLIKHMRRSAVPFLQLKNVKIPLEEGVLHLVKLLAESCNFTESNTTPWVFFTFFNLYKWYQIAQSITHFLMT